MAREKDFSEEYELTPEEEEALEQSIAEIERGECVTAEQFFAELRAIRLRNNAALPRRH